MHPIQKRKKIDNNTSKKIRNIDWLLVNQSSVFFRLIMRLSSEGRLSDTRERGLVNNFKRLRKSLIFRPS